MTFEVLDACCGVGGASAGYMDAGFRVTGIDIVDQPDYCGDALIIGDAVDYIIKHGYKYNFIHTGHPCQYDCMLTAGTNQHRKHMYVDLMGPIRQALNIAGRPWVMEQPPGKASKRMRVDLTLCGNMFQLNTFRHRNFEIEGFEVPEAFHVKHDDYTRGWRHGVYREGRNIAVYGDGGGKGTIAEWQTAMGIDWTSNRKSIAEAIPPAYTNHIGKDIMDQLECV